MGNVLDPDELLEHYGRDRCAGICCAHHLWRRDYSRQSRFLDLGQQTNLANTIRQTCVNRTTSMARRWF